VVAAHPTREIVAAIATRVTRAVEAVIGRCQVRMTAALACNSSIVSSEC
jgi:hypothetical protein